MRVEVRARVGVTGEGRVVGESGVGECMGLCRVGDGPWQLVTEAYMHHHTTIPPPPLTCALVKCSIRLPITNPLSPAPS